MSSVDGDIEARNVMILVQKLHAINIELVHLAKVTNLEDTVYIDATRIVLNKEFIKIGTVRRFSVLNMNQSERTVLFSR